MILRCCRWIPARTAEVKDESETFEVGGKKVSELEVRGVSFLILGAQELWRVLRACTCEVLHSRKAQRRHGS